jgi:hypothetical protein
VGGWGGAMGCRLLLAVYSCVHGSQVNLDDLTRNIKSVKTTTKDSITRGDQEWGSQLYARGCSGRQAICCRIAGCFTRERRKNSKLRWAVGVAQRPVLSINKPKKRVRSEAKTCSDLYIFLKKNCEL